MRRVLISLALVLGGLCPAQAAGISTDPSQVPAGTYALEPRHSQVLFDIVHMGLTDFWGRFNTLSGTLTFDNTAPEKSSVSVTIDMDSIDTPVQRLNEELASASTFDAANYPTATFQSTSLTRTGPNTGTITGNLTLRNVTKPVTLDVTFNGGGAGPMGAALGFRATATIKRSDFGLDTMPWNGMVGDDVKLEIEAMFLQKKS